MSVSPKIHLRLVILKDLVLRSIRTLDSKIQTQHPFFYFIRGKSHGRSSTIQAVVQTILLVEDSPEDKEAIIRAFRKAGVDNSIHWCPDGDSALDYLNHRGEYADASKAPRPGIVLLDLNLPGTDGGEVLREIKTSPDLRYRYARWRWPHGGAALT
ncbi:MAG: response regulator [Acidobacteria bacterium]|nr:MAG: response regulator [Acidobacteriota bacterium]